MKKNKPLFLFLIIFALGFILDLVSKFIIRSSSFTTTGHFVDISHILNYGSLWGLFSSLTFINIIFIIISVAALTAIYFFQRKQPELSLSLGLMSAGVLGNLFDRIFHGAVFDFIDFHFWPVFNLADTFIVCGVVIAIFILAKEELNKK
jgi:signal peptidase II